MANIKVARAQQPCNRRQATRVCSCCCVVMHLVVAHLLLLAKCAEIAGYIKRLILMMGEETTRPAVRGYPHQHLRLLPCVPHLFRKCTCMYVHCVSYNYHWFHIIVNDCNGFLAFENPRGTKLDTSFYFRVFSWILFEWHDTNTTNKPINRSA